MNKEQIEQIAKRVMTKLESENASTPESHVMGINGVFEKMEDAVEAAFQGYKHLKTCSMAQKQKYIDSIRCEISQHIDELAELGVKETGMGKVAHKKLKHQLVIDKTPGTEDLRADAYAGDDGLTLLEMSAFGVIGAIAPSTNPSETVICNAIGMIAAGNAVVFGPHPGAFRTSNRAVELINIAIAKAGGPLNIVTTVSNPTMEKADIMMNHPKINMLCATGGPGVVKAVLSTGKKAIGAGAGNPPVLVDETADIERAARSIIAGCSFDNNLPCIAEKECFVVESVADYLIFNMKSSGGYLLEDPAKIEKLQSIVLTEKGPSRDFVGKDATYILKAIGIDAPEDTQCIVLESEFKSPFVQHELMMPILPVVRVKDVEEGIALCVKAEHGFRHTAMCHSKNIDVLTEYARRIQTTIFVKNAPSYAGIGFMGEGYTTFTIAGPTGEGLTSARSFTRKRRCVLAEGFNIK